MSTTNYVAGTLVTSDSLNAFDRAAYAALTSVAGTNTITATGSSALVLVAGQLVRFFPAVTNTGATTININGGGAKAITKYGATAIVAGDLVAGVGAQLYYDGTQWQLLNPQASIPTSAIVPVANGGTGAATAAAALINLGATGRLIGTQTFTSSGTYTPTAGTTSVIVEIQGGGGAGGGTPATAAGNCAVGGGGGAGGYGITRLTSGFSGATVTIGAGGTGVSAGLGGSGGTTSFGAFTATGGSGGGASVSDAIVAAGGGTGGLASGGTILNLRGASGLIVTSAFAQQIFNGGFGAPSRFGNGGVNSQTASGQVSGVAALTATYGTGGGGASAAASSGAAFGGNGRPGIVIVYEYA